jgi:glycosyltransferase involved in cell wall biosynthesis
MRIGVDIRLAYHQMAGISWYAIRLLTALSKIDTENRYVLLQHRRQKAPLVQAPNFQRVRLWAPTHHRLEQWLLSLETSLLHLDLIHSPDFIPPLHNRVPAVITVHDLAFLLYPNFVTEESARYYGQIEEAVKRASRIIAVSHSTRNDLIELIGAPESKIDVIYEAADPLFRPLPPAEARRLLERTGIEPPEEFILFVGTIEPRKNLATLLRAYAILRQRYRITAPLLLSGAMGWLSEGLVALVEELGLRDHVRFLGRTSAEQLLALYNLATVLAHPAHYEGFGLTPLEAMACATPVVCSQAGSLPEVTGDAAILVPPEDEEAWAVALHRVLTDKALQASLQAKGLARAGEFSWEKAARQTLETYRKAVV